ncbi:patatin-like phospholipase family protein [Luteimonas sp. MC1825]|uniref:patatin-like phospholipase family protein n=1 Tax=Luteimonas sp. MC1825 TaxID=2761107 RepID=UPI001C87FDDE|nr:patatin-like phospholipase family protein [Luteimonas sp. MC1825]
MSIAELLAESAGPGADTPKQGVAIALSGGGYRAMLFHTGVLWRLGQLGFFQDKPLEHNVAGVTSQVGRLERISSVSGGSITAAVLALALERLEHTSAAAFDGAFKEHVVGPVRQLAGKNLAGTKPSGAFQVIKDIVMPGRVSEHISAAYRRELFGDKTLQDLPDRVRFVINASNLQSGALWRFSKPFMRDWKVGEVPNPRVSLADAVAASSAFPPVLAPALLSLKESDYSPNSGDPRQGLQRAPFTTNPTLADGGVYDNLGLETCFKRYKTLFVSNAGKPFSPEPTVKSNWVSIGRRCLDVVDTQVLNLRKRLLMQALVSGERTGAFWDIEHDIGVHQCAGALPCPQNKTALLAQVPTDLAHKDGALQECLINWGYAVTDAAVRTWFNKTLLAPGGFPYPIGVG